eukprot:scaffold16556_cov20-Tisochrysis_lutea.AAC.2
MNSILRIIPGLPGHGGVINKQPTNAHTGAQPAVAGPQQSQYIALYDWRRCHVRAFCRATSDAAFSLLAQHADHVGVFDVHVAVLQDEMGPRIHSRAVKCYQAHVCLGTLKSP